MAKTIVEELEDLAILNGHKMFPIFSKDEGGGSEGCKMQDD